MKNIQETIDLIFSLYENHGGQEYIGEPVSLLEHMSQAAQLAIDEGYDDEVVLAAFFHDIGHICVDITEENDMDGFGVMHHETAGAHYLNECGFSQRLIKLVEYHVSAKRYLTYKYPEYFHSLTEASKKTLEFQGGVMSIQEARKFEQDPLFNASIALRRWDEMAKEKNVPVNNLTLLKQICYRVLMNS